MPGSTKAPGTSRRPATADRTYFLQGPAAAALSEAIKKEEKTLFKLFQRQIELGRLELPQTSDDLCSSAGGDEAEEVPAAVRERIQLLIQGLAPGQEGGQLELERQQLEGISKSAWGVANPGYVRRGEYQSTTQAAYAYRQQEIEKMKEEGELATDHHKRRDANTAFAEACLRNAALKRDAAEAGRRK